MKGMLTTYPGLRIMYMYEYILMYILTPNLSLFCLFVFVMETKTNLSEATRTLLLRLLTSAIYSLSLKLTERNSQTAHCVITLVTYSSCSCSSDELESA